jgi:hypothetical protein
VFVGFCVWDIKVVLDSYTSRLLPVRKFGASSTEIGGEIGVEIGVEISGSTPLSDFVAFWHHQF